MRLNILHPSWYVAFHSDQHAFLADVDVEALGDWFPEDTHYATQEGDIWSLGVILVNLVCGRNPWRIASPSDESFTAFLADPNFLRRILPISEQCLFVLSQIFTVNPCHRISLNGLRNLILEIDTFTMNEEELRRAHLAAQSSPTPTSTVTTTTTSPTTTALSTYPATSPTVCAPNYDPDPTLHLKSAVIEVPNWPGRSAFIYSDRESVFVFEDQETPSLLADSGSPSPPTSSHRSRSASSNFSSLPPTPLLDLLGVKDAAARSALPGTSLWDIFKNPNPDSQHRAELRINPTSPDTLSATACNPFFR